MVNAPWRTGTTIRVTKHFTNRYVRRWDWTPAILQDAIAHAYRVERSGKSKFEIYILKDGYKKIVAHYDREEDTLLCITGSEGGYHV